ncbi:LON peptidase substrate-binding domain-containing protein [Salinibius halmophilus]|uniref:LON peptidase substrate-binding domain-containing protein n=1 Tax=Salinibius halmophilus TaxID=1853216 RepID=UPI000E66E7EE|nr:LON peptidase substrate-binding domain-containing protein [Salinibius halmophilus]
MLQHVPVFPLSVMPYPSCRMPLRIFEPRYLNMVAEAMRGDRSFIMTMQTNPEEVESQLVDPYTGILRKAVRVEIEDFDQGEDGLLHIEVAGREWVLLSDLQKDDESLWRASVEPLPNTTQSPDDSQLNLIYRVIQDAAHASQVQVPDVEIATTEQKIGYLSTLLPIGVVQRIELVAAEDNAHRIALLNQWVSISEA